MAVAGDALGAGAWDSAELAVLLELVQGWVPGFVGMLVVIGYTGFLLGRHACQEAFVPDHLNG